MKITRPALALAMGIVALGSVAYAQPGTVFVEGRLGAMLPVAEYRDDVRDGITYSVAAGYEFTEFFDGLFEFTHSFNDAQNLHFQEQGIDVFSDEVKQTFIVELGPRINFAPSEYLVRPYGFVLGGWYHFANFNSAEINGQSLFSDEDDDAGGLQAGLGLQGTIMQLYERRGDRVPLVELTFGAQGAYHQAFMSGRQDRQFVILTGSFGVRF